MSDLDRHRYRGARALILLHERYLARWRLPLVDVTEEDSDRTFLSRWNVEYSIDAMLEHAVMHPVRHAFQLRELMEAR